MKKCVIAVFLFLCIIGNAQNEKEIYQRAKISINHQNDLKTLESLGIPIEHGNHKKGTFVISEFSVSELETVRNAGFLVEVIIEDAAAYFLEQNRLNKHPERNPTCGDTSVDYQTPDNFTLGSMGGYLTYQEMLDQLDLMKSLYPNLITQKENISDFLTEGQPDNSTNPPIGGNGIKWVKISDNPDSDAEGEPQLLYTAIHHAREPASLSQLIFYMWYLLENYDTDPEVQSVINNTELYFVPVINPDGYLYNEKTDPNGGGYWRKNRKNGYGTDLNRNYDYYINGDPNDGIWGGEGASNNTGDETYHGPTPFSEVETQAIKWFVENHDFVMAFNNHTSGDLLLYPYGYTDNMPTPENDLFVAMSSELVSQNGFNNILSSELYPAAGDSDDFMYGTMGTHDKIYAFTPEIGPSFWPSSNQIVPISKGMMYLNLTAAKMVNNYASVNETSSVYVGEEATIDSPFEIKRLGITGNGNFTVTINPISSNIASVGAPVNFNNMDPFETDNGIIQYTLEAGTTSGDDIVYELIVNNGSFDNISLINKKFGNLVAIFEDPGNSVTDNFDNNGWGTTNQTYVSPSSSITDSPSGNYQNNENKSIELSNEVDLTSALGANASFYAKWDIENNYDYVQFEVSTNNGSSWIAQCGKYTNDGSGNNSQPTGEPLYDGTQNSWVLEEIDLSDYLGENILVRFQFRSDNGVREDGFYFDDLKINVIDEGTIGISDFENSQFSIYPNPVKDILNINTSISNYILEIYTIQGQLINEKTVNSGSQVVDYSSLANGVYILKLSSEKASQTYKIIKQ
ncbi:MAG: carboxypeptidase T [Flavobacteriaceae bacterium]|jgi:hypothetical protein